ncbi:MAG: hypothetical protein GXO91_07525 [FCB group bacterium]|nr:hypothetical protein [FCB group bacterium]
MSFLSPLFLWAIPLMSIPLILHLLNRRNIKTVEFSSIRFLKKLEHDSIRKLKILQILLLIIRTLMILAIVMMLSRPVLKGVFNWINDPASTFVAVVIDDTFSNFGDSEFISRQDIDRKALAGILNRLDDDVTLSISSLTAGERYRGRVGDFRRNDDFLKIGNGTGNFFEEFRTIRKTLERDYANLELYLLSDAQAVNFENTISDSLDLENWNVFFSKLPELETNLAISDVKLLTEIPMTNIPVEITVEVLNTGRQDVENALMQMIINDINVGQQVISIQAGQKRSYSFLTAFHDTGRIRGKVVLQNDNRNEDNTYYFHVNLPDKLTVQLVSHTADDALFVENALKALNKDARLLDISVNTETALPALDLRQTDVFILQGIQAFSQGVQDKLKAFLESGGHLILFPGSDQEKLISLDFLNISTASAGQVVLPGEAFQQIDDKTVSGAVGKALIDGAEGAGIRFFRFLKLADTEHAVVRLKNDQSIWNRQSYSDGLVDLFAFAPDLKWSNFPLKGSFIPFWNLLLYSGKTGSQSSHLTTDQGWSLKLNVRDLKNKLTLLLPDGTTILLNADSDQRITLKKIPQIGFISVLSGQKVLDELAVNPPPVELSSKPLTDEQIRDALTDDTVIIEDYKGLASAMENARHGTELWYWFLIALVILTLLEMYLANVYGTRSGGQ